MHSLRHSNFDPDAGGRRAAYELRRRPDGFWAVFRDGLYVASIGTRERALAARCLRFFVQQLDAEAREASRARAVGPH
jgi:hypothetical protein